MNRLAKFAYAVVRAGAADSRLPPGRFRYFESRNRHDRRFFLKMRERFGPVFRLWWRDNHTTMVIGHDRARRLLAENEGRLPCATIDATPFFPHGFLRAMEGETHRHYRRILTGAIVATPVLDHEAAISTDLAKALSAIASEPDDNKLAARMRTELRLAARRTMLRLFFGVDSSEPVCDELIGLYRQFGEGHPATRLKPRHAPLFSAIRAIIDRRADAIRHDPEKHPPSLLKHIATGDSDDLDATTIGNLIYAVEPAYYDLSSLWRWIWKFLTDNPKVAEEARAHFASDRGQGTRYAEAIVNETLRLEQSEALVRRVTEDVDFEGYRLPIGSTLQVCLWEGHKDPSAFDRPFAFDPARFLDKPPGPDQFAPFGLDRHHCPGAGFTVATSALFVEELVTGYHWTAAHDGEPVRGVFHWEPNPGFSVRLKPRADAAPGSAVARSSPAGFGTSSSDACRANV